MTTPIAVELFCKVEKTTVATVTLPGPGKLDAERVRAGLKVRDRLRCPEAGRVQDGEQLVCSRCANALWWRTQHGDLYAAMPGSVEIRA